MFQDNSNQDTSKERKVAFIGHRDFYDPELEKRLYHAIEEEVKSGCKKFTMGTHGQFDRLALYVCKEIRKLYKDIKIEVVITSFAQIKPIIDHDEIFGDEVYKPYEDVETTMYEIEETHFKRKITESNKQMIDSCDTLICYVRPNVYRSGAKSTMNYAKKKGLRIVNLYNYDK